tara:strand:- start:26263 stop:26547 length:285 start_codon:yes stop_codon:yes gene_type:complete
LKDILEVGLNNIWSQIMATMNISLPDSLREWVESKSQQGSYANKSDYVRDLIRRDQLQSQKLKAMQDAVSKGLESGEPKAFDKSAFKQRMKGSL